MLAKDVFQCGKSIQSWHKFLGYVDYIYEVKLEGGFMRFVCLIIFLFLVLYPMSVSYGTWSSNDSRAVNQTSICSVSGIFTSPNLCRLGELVYYDMSKRITNYTPLEFVAYHCDTSHQIIIGEEAVICVLTRERRKKSGSLGSH
jgi:hypothetical protein